MSRLDEPLAKLVGDRTAKVLAKSLDLTTLGDLLRHYPRRYAERGRLTDLTRLEVDEHITVMAEIAKVAKRQFRNRRGNLLEVVVTDGRGHLKLTFFNQAWRERELRPGLRGLFAGKVARFRDELQLNQPDYQLMDQDDDPGAAALFADALIPVYPAAASMPSWKISQCVRVALDTLGEVGDPLPDDLLRRRDMPGLRQAFGWIHTPKSWGEVNAARDRLKWDEAFVLQVALAQRRLVAQTQTAVPRRARPDGLLAAFDARLPFTLTDGQVKVGAEIAGDLAAEHPMHRLLQGEVGSGKAQPLDALVLTPRGYVPMGEMAVGTEVVTPSGEVALVDGVFPQGVRDVWRMRLLDGTNVECDDEHLWRVTGPGPDGHKEPSRVLTTRQIREDLSTHGRQWAIAAAVPADLGASELPLDPYDMGVRCAQDPVGGHIPGAYLNASVRDRHALLQGWLDACGSYTDELGLGFPVRSRESAEDVNWLVRSLGGLAPPLTNPPGEKSEWRHVIALPDAFPPFRAKAADYPGGVPDWASTRPIMSVERVGPKPVQCISVAHPDHMYVTDNFTPTHNTMIALRSMLTVVDAGGQAAMLAPTEVLAQQHHRSIVDMMGDLADGPGMLGGSDVGTKVTLLTGSMGVPARRAALLDLVTGEAGIVIGTHALIEDKVKFHDLGLVVVDEQHRFGVEQRDALRGKSERPPHLLVMTATPIPRTVAMTVFGDLETSVLDQLPSGRSPIATHVVPAREKPNFLERTWERLREEVAKGHQAYIVCPRIGDQEDDPKARKPKRGRKAADEDLPAEAYQDDPDDLGADADDAGDKRPPLAVLDVAAGLAAGPLAGLRIGVLHGRMAPDAKDDVMRRFTAGDVDVLVATTVIEVGVNVPNATVMVIMDSDRFGVSQLHQLRGRVGRGSAPGLCLLVSDMPMGTAARERLDAVAATLDGFELSRIDLEQRREGDVLGEAQSGSRSSLRMLAVVRDEDVIVAARDEATEIVARDPELSDHPELRSALASLLNDERAEYLDKG
ncbi:DEAD/DEAH box helicase [Yinghuangia sp. ASG 101]|uniref:helicase-related protein n=1 Tax=Yinghuangia sp. ASG 101 TaxID=2896848 RepID=UPI001E2C2D6A|nr:helicase-related protein [Yinghuangia sp. ASG 101]UGQ14142.1 DEAD/DEAH box helicase [Yinghuangia sp. ASG 101]